MTGYVVVNALEDALELVDHAGDADRVLEAVAHLAAAAGFRKVRFPALHYRSELCRKLRSLACRYEQWMGSGGWMVRTVSLAGTLGRLRPVLARRLAAAGLDDWRGDLLIEDPRERVLLGIEGGRVEVATGRPAADRRMPCAAARRWPGCSSARTPPTRPWPRPACVCRATPPCSPGRSFRPSSRPSATGTTTEAPGGPPGRRRRVLAGPPLSGV